MVAADMKRLTSLFFSQSLVTSVAARFWETKTPRTVGVRRWRSRASFRERYKVVVVFQFTDIAGNVVNDRRFGKSQIADAKNPFIPGAER